MLRQSPKPHDTDSAGDVSSKACGGHNRVLVRAVRILVPLVILLGVWQLVALLIAKPFLVPSPLDVLIRLGELAATARFWKTIALTLLRILAGFVLGMLVGGILAALMYASTVANLLLSPLIKIIRTTPVVSFILIILLWIASSFLPIVISTLMVIPIAWANVFAGLESVDDDVLMMARLYRLSWWTRVRRIYLPACTPHIMTASVTGMGLAWKSGVTAEVLALPLSAIGHELYNAKIYLESVDVFAWTIVVIILSMVLEQAIVALNRRMCRRRRAAR